jgi:signal transduction histidine kinase
MTDYRQSDVVAGSLQDLELVDRCIAALIEKDRLNHLGRFIQGLIHNVNGPLQNMSMLVEVLIRGQEKLENAGGYGSVASCPDFGMLIQKQGKRLHQLSQQISALADMLRSFMVLHEIERNETEVDINLVLSKLAETFRSDLFFKHQVTLDLRLTKNLPLVRILGRHLIPALVHLFNNAVVAMKKTAEKRLVVESRLEEGIVRILLRDTGCGLQSEEVRQRCFDLFYSHWQPSEGDQTGEENHMGFGLYAARRLLEPYGIEVSLKSADGETTAVVDIPIPFRE